MNNPRIIAIIPTHGAGDAFIECIESLLTQTVQFHQVIIINNNVKDGSIQKLIEKLNISHNTTNEYSAGKYNQTEIKIIELKENTGVTGGRNAGIAALPTEYDYVCFVDHDMISEKNMVEELLNVAQQKDAIGIVTPKIYYWDDKKIIWSAGTDVNVSTGQTLFRGGEDKGQYEEVQEVAVAPAIFLVKKVVIDAIRLFDTKYFAVYEDTDFCFQAKQSGLLTYYAPKAISYHKIPYNPELAMRRLIERTYWIGRNRYLFLRKFHYFSLKTLLFVPVYCMYYTYLSLKYGSMRDAGNYFRGVYDGITIKI